MRRAHPARLLVLAASTGALLLPAGALSEGLAPPPGPVAGLTAGDMFRLADDALAARRMADAEAFLRALTQDRDVDIRSEARFRLALLLDSNKRGAEAAVQLRAILDERPQAGRVRIELARILAAMGEEGKAGAQLRAAQAGGLPEDVAQVVDRMAASLRASRPVGGSFEIALAPDSNINRGTASATVSTGFGNLVLSDEARETSGTGVRAAGQVYGRATLSPSVTLIPRAGGEAALYRTAAANDISGTIGLALEWQGEKSRITPGLAASWRNYGGRAYARTLSASLDWRRPVGRRALMTAGAGLADVDFAGNDLQDGRILSVSFGLERALSARSGVALGLSAARQTARDPGYASASGGVSLVGWRDIGRTTLFASASVRRLETDARLFPFNDRRKESFVQASGGAVFRQITVAGFSPLIRATFERNRSTLENYDYRRVTGQFGITRAF